MVLVLPISPAFELLPHVPATQRSRVQWAVAPHPFQITVNDVQSSGD